MQILGTLNCGKKDSSTILTTVETGHVATVQTSSLHQAQQTTWLEAWKKKALWAEREQLPQEEHGLHPPSLSYLKSSRGARVKDPLRTVLSTHCV